MTMRRQTRQQLDEAISAGGTPRIPRSGFGLVLPHGKKRNVLVNQSGALTAAGKHYYEKTDTTPPAKFDFTQEPTRAGRSLMIRLLDGSKRAVSRFDSVAKQFVPTAMGKRFRESQGSIYCFVPSFDRSYEDQRQRLQ